MTSHVHVQSWLSQMDMNPEQEDDFLVDSALYAGGHYRTPSMITAAAVRSHALDCRPDSPLLGAEHPFINARAALKQRPVEPQADYTQAVNALMDYDSDEDVDDASERDTQEDSSLGEVPETETARVSSEQDAYLAPLPSEVPSLVSKSNSWSSVASAFPATPTSLSLNLASRSRASSSASVFILPDDAPPSPSVTMSRQPSTYFGTEVSSSRPTSYSSIRKRESASALPYGSSVPAVPGRRLGFPSHKSMGVLRGDETEFATSSTSTTPTHVSTPSATSTRQRSRTVSSLFRNAVYLEEEDNVAELQKRLVDLDTVYRAQEQNPLASPVTNEDEEEDDAPPAVPPKDAADSSNLLAQPASHWSPGSSTTSVDKAGQIPSTPSPLSAFSLSGFGRTPRTSFIAQQQQQSPPGTPMTEQKKTRKRRRFTSFMTKITSGSAPQSDVPPTPTLRSSKSFPQQQQLALDLPAPIVEADDYQLMVDTTPAHEMDDPFAALPVARSRRGSDAVAPSPTTSALPIAPSYVMALPSRASKEATPFPTLHEDENEEPMVQPLQPPKRSRFSIFGGTAKSFSGGTPPPLPISLPSGSATPSAERTIFKSASTLSLTQRAKSSGDGFRDHESRTRPPSPQKSVKSMRKSRVGKKMFDVFSRENPMPSTPL